VLVLASMRGHLKMSASPRPDFHILPSCHVLHWLAFRGLGLWVGRSWGLDVEQEREPYASNGMNMQLKNP
jgi:hypothetical protein